MEKGEKRAKKRKRRKKRKKKWEKNQTKVCFHFVIMGIWIPNVWYGN